ncbi:MAG: DNA repair protein RecO [Deltaproteobacteria bacterium]|nr:DNA repair protein RecO [Deltaproteobacteria bacterium]
MKRGLYRTEAVILNSFDYGESDRILAFYTEAHGKLKGIAKGARRSRKRFVGNLEPASHITLGFFYTEKSELVRVESVALVDGFTNVRRDIERLSEACYIVELAAEMTREGMHVPAVYGLILSFLNMLNRGGPAGVVLRFFEIKLLSALGLMPRLDACVACRRDFGGGNAGGGRVSFNSDRGGAVCSRCDGGALTNIRISAGSARFLCAAERLDADKLGRLRPNALFVKEAGAVLDDFIRHQIGKELKTRVFLDKLRGAADC